MANNKDFIVKNPIEIGGSTSLTIGDADTSGTGGFKLSNASYDSVSQSLGSGNTTPSTFKFNNNGTKLFCQDGNDRVYEYALSTAYDITSASLTRNFYLGTQTTSSTSLAFNNDGTKMYIGEFTNDTILQYSLSTGFDVSTASYDGVTLDVSSESGNPSVLLFNSDGTKLWVSDGSTPAIYQYNLTTGFDLSTGSYAPKTLNLNVSPVLAVSGFEFNADGTELIVLGSSSTLYKYDLSTAYDISTATRDTSVSFSVSSEDASPTDFLFYSSGQKMLILGASNDTIFQYSTSVATGTFDLSTGSYFTDTPSADVEYTFSNAGDVQAFQLEVTGNNAGFDISSASYESKTFSFSSQDSIPRQIYIRDNGLDMYMVGANNDNVFQYTLSTAWDISTASYASKTFSVSSEESNPSGISFKSDGTKMYISGATGDDISQYSLSTAWDITTASFDNVTAGSGQDTGVSGVFFKYDGTKFYMMGQADTDINEFNMSTAWDISTASFNQKSSSISSYEGAPWNLYFSTDGTKVFVIGTTGDEVNEFSLSTAWDISTLSHVRVFSVSSQETNPSGIFFKDDGTKMYITGYTGDAVYQYDTSTPITVTWNSTIEWAGGTAPTSPVNGEKDIYSFVTDDGGTSYIGNFTGNAFS